MALCTWKRWYAPPPLLMGFQCVPVRCKKHMCLSLPPTWKRYVMLPPGGMGHWLV